ncbi:MAG: AbrB/MazE/SpoVT family DNA-binding domain-containing protein [Gemmatimonadetes bacterium]|nr:AbrB/MazE/SpoVT family DNA-binding domain-containing protein [Gemmatimonadota bacterium]
MAAQGQTQNEWDNAGDRSRNPGDGPRDYPAFFLPSSFFLYWIGEILPKLSAKRQITLPADHCRLAGIEPGDECLSFLAGGHITIFRQQPGSAWGCLAHLEADPTVSDEASRQDAIERKRDRTP